MIILLALHYFVRAMNSSARRNERISHIPLLLLANLVIPQNLLAIGVQLIDPLVLIRRQQSPFEQLLSFLRDFLLLVQRADEVEYFGLDACHRVERAKEVGRVRRVRNTRLIIVLVRWLGAHHHVLLHHAAMILIRKHHF